MFDEGIQADATGRVRVERGPVSLVVSAWENGVPQPEVCLRAAESVDALLAEIAAVLPLLSVAWTLTNVQDLSRLDAASLPFRMWRAARATGHPEMTPMCAVAGAIGDALADRVLLHWHRGSDRVLQDTLLPSGIKVVISNGGDVSLRLSPGTCATVGLVPALGAPGVDETVTVQADSPIRGVATSGLGGRGLTQGVADAVTVFAATAVLADALATRLCNASRLLSPRVVSVPAGTLRPGCDIAALPVTAHVDVLTEEEKDAALEGIRCAAQPLMALGTVLALRATVQGKSLWLPGILTRY